MHLIVTRSFPPEVGGMQNLMWGLTNSLSKHKLIKVFADDNNFSILEVSEKTVSNSILNRKHLRSIA